MGPQADPIFILMIVQLVMIVLLYRKCFLKIRPLVRDDG
jgi:hypothetical protein